MRVVAAVTLVLLGFPILLAQYSSGKSSEAASPTFYKDALPILQEHCQSCHRPGEIAPMPLVTYAQTRPWARRIAATVEMKMMPPWFADARYGHFANDSSLTEQQIATISAWAQAGAPAGSAHHAPPPQKWTTGWNIAQPVAVVKMPQAVKIPARGDVEYTYEIVPPTSPKIVGCKWRRCGRQARRMCTMRWFTFVLRIQRGCGMHRWASRLRLRP